MPSMILAALAVPMTLLCTLDEHGTRMPMTLRLDADRGAVRYAMPPAAPFVTARALFTRDHVTFDRFTLDRRSFAIIRDGESITTALHAQPRQTRGRCRVDRRKSR